LKDDAGRAFGALSTRATAALIALAGFALATVTATAQSSSDIARSLDPLFQGVLARPANLSNTLQYAASASANDIESAISAYEQLLFYNPRSARTRFELGVLYFRLGSYAMARSYFETALALPDMPADLRPRTEELLALASKKLMPDQFSGFVQTGLRYQTNASVGPGSQAVLASGYNSSNRFVAQPDWNWFGAFGLNYVHDFENQSGTTFEATAQGYDAQQFTLHQFDVGLLDLRAGPRFQLFSGTANAMSVKPYVIVTGATLGNLPYYGALGGGLTLHATWGNISLDPLIEITQQSFKNSSLYPVANGLSGMLTTAALQASGPVYGGMGFQARFAYGHDETDYNPYSYNAYAMDLALPWNFSFPGDGRMWTLTPIFGVSYWQYAAPDPAFAPATTPHTTEWRAGLGFDIPIWKQIALGTLVQYRSDVSNIAAFTMQDWQFSAGPTFKF
jgi:hypothetical protein